MNHTRVRARVAAWLHIIFALGGTTAFATSRAEPGLEPDWSAGAVVPLTGRANPYGWDATTLVEKVRRGKLHALNYPVSVTGLRLPARPTLKILELQPGDPLFGLLRMALRLREGIRTFGGFWDWLGLNEYPAGEKEAEYEIPFPSGVRPEHPMGVAVTSRIGLAGFATESWRGLAEGATVGHDGSLWIPESSARSVRGQAAMVTVSCAACHSATLFGKPVLGLTNRFSRANEFFRLGQQGISQVPPAAFAVGTGASREERALYAYTRERMRAIGLRKPVALGLDTSLAQVALSLSRRAPTADAPRSRESERHPRPNFLDSHVADSKPAVWWNVKYKNRWLSDGSVLSGNPILTNLLWNEIGRGADLPDLGAWIERNQAAIEELTTAVFATHAPHWQHYLPPSFVDVERARRGEEHFTAACASCHGTYVKDWARGTDTVEVRYHAETPVRDVGTDPGRREGMRALAEGLNPLSFSRRHGVVIAEQKGYVPPPLEGIWARYPYLHNNSVPSLCALMTPPESRPTSYYMGAPVVPGRDYDLDCVGYPLAERAPAEWRRDPAYHYEVGPVGSGRFNGGHYDRIFRIDGRERFTAEEKRDLLHFLKSL